MRSNNITEFKNRRIEAKILSFLEPFFLQNSRNLFNVAEKVDFFIFFIKGAVQVGYKTSDTFVNNLQDYSPKMQELLQKKIESREKLEYPVTLYPGQLVGLFELWFGKPTKFKYRVSTEDNSFQAFFIRKQNWGSVLKEFETDLEIKNLLKFVLVDYVAKIFMPIQNHNDLTIENLRKEIQN
jgi:hypothetical protein